MNILITGGNGYIAKSISASYISKLYSTTSLSRQGLNLLNKKEVDAFFQKQQFDVVIHTANVGGSRLTLDVPENVYVNLTMFDNLYENRHRYGKLISFGSGAEIYHSQTPYGLSKKIINKIIQSTSNFYNLRVFAVFDKNELSTRFIKNNIISPLTGKPLTIHKNKYMDFFFMEDLIKVIQFYIENDSSLDKAYDCCYKEKYTLFDIATIINSVHDTQSKITIEQNEGLGDPYTGTHKKIPISFVGLTEGIKITYEELLNNKYNLRQ